MAAVLLLALLLASTSVPPADAGPAICVLRAQVVDERGDPVAGARLGARSRTAGTSRDAPSWAATAEQGRVELRLAPDLYRWAVASNRHPTTAERTVDVLRSCEDGNLGRVELPPGGDVHGRVLDAAGEPLPEATVKISWDPDTPDYLRRTHELFLEPHRETVTGPDGSFRLPGLRPEAEYDLSATHPGHLSSGAKARPGTAPLVVRLDPGALVAVEVVDVEGLPIEGAEVRVRAVGSGETAGGVRIVHRTDGQGVSDHGGREPGEAAIEVRAPGYEHARRVVDLEAGELRRVRFELSPVPSGAVALRVVDQDGTAVPQAKVHLAAIPRTSDGTYLSGSTDDRGRLSWPQVPHGRYEVTVQVPTGVLAERPEPVRLALDGGGLEREIVLRRPEGRPQEGRVVGPDGAGVPGASVGVHAATVVRTVTRAEGRFRFDHLPYGEHTVYLEVPGVAGEPPRKGMVAEEAEPWVFEVARGVDVSGRIVVPPGAELDPGEWQVLATSSAGGSVQGWLDGDLGFRLPPLAAGRWTLKARNGRARGEVDVELERGNREVRRDLPVTLPDGFPVHGTLLHHGEPLHGARVGLRSREGASFAAGDTTGADGHFQIDDVPPGTHSLAVHWGGAPVLHRIVEIDGPTALDRELRFGWLRGRVEIEGLDPTALHVRLHPRGPAGEPWYYSTHTYPEWVVPRPDGTFEVGPLEEGRWAIEVSAPGHVEAKREIVVAGADVEDLVLAPEPTAGLSFRLVTATGRLPERVSATYRSETGEVVRSHLRVLDPVLHLDDAPPGRGALEVDTPFGTVGPIPMEVPGPVVEIRVPLQGRIEVRVSALGEDEAAGARISIRPVEDGSGAIERRLGRWGRVQEVLPAGLYEVRVEATDGRSWSELVQVPEQETVKVDLR